MFKKFNLILLFLLNISFSLFSDIILHDVSIFLDNSENSSPNFAAISSMVEIAICQAVSPIITTSRLLNILLKGKKSDTPAYKFDLNDWIIFRTNTKDFFLLIPTNYYKKNLESKNTEEFKKEAANYKENTLYEILSGFKIDDKSKIFTKFSVASINKLSIEEIDNFAPMINKIELANLIKIFTKGKDDIFGKWNIYLAGHGMAPYKIENISKFLHKNIINETEDIGLQVAGLPLNDFVNLLQFLTKNINTNFLYYLTCFGGDVNFIIPFITTILNEKKNVKGGMEEVNFTIATGALTSEAVTVELTAAMNPTCSLPRDLNKHFDFTNYFKYLNEYTDIKTTKATIFKDKELNNILKSVVQLDKFVNNVPSVKFPHSNIFRAVTTDEKIGIISEVLAKKHTLAFKDGKLVKDLKPILFKSKDVVLIYPQEVDSDIEIESREDKSTAIVSMVPGISLVQLNGLKTNIKFSGFIKASLSSTAPLFKKYFYIKKLILTNDLKPLFNFNNNYKLNSPITLDNVIVKVFLSVLDFQAHKLHNATVEMRFTTPDKNIFIASQHYDVFALEPTGNKFKKVSDNDLVNTVYNYYSEKGDYNGLLDLLSKEDFEILKKLDPNLPKIIANKTAQEKADKEAQENLEKNTQLFNEFVKDQNKLAKMMISYPNKWKLLTELINDKNKLNEFLKHKDKLKNLFNLEPEKPQPSKPQPTKPVAPIKPQVPNLKAQQFKNVLNILTNQANILQQFKQAQANKNTKKANQLKPYVQKIRQSLIKMPLNITNNQGQTPIMLNPKIAFILPEIGKPRSKVVANAKDAKGKRVIQYVIQSNLVDNITIYKLLADAGVVVTKNDIGLINNKLKSKPKIRNQVVSLLKKK